MLIIIKVKQKIYFLRNLIVWFPAKWDNVKKRNVKTNFFISVSAMPDFLSDCRLHSFINFYLFCQTYFRLFSFAFRNPDLLGFTHFLLKNTCLYFYMLNIEHEACMNIDGLKKSRIGSFEIKPYLSKIFRTNSNLERLHVCRSNYFYIGSRQYIFYKLWF